MDKNIIGLLLILAGVCYGSMAIDNFYNHTLGWLVENGWLKTPPPPAKGQKSALGRKATILIYSIIMIASGIFILIKL